MQLKPKVNVIMATFNGEKYIRKQIDSILKQDYPNFSLCIRDDGSTDDTVNIIQQYEYEYENVIVIPNESNLGVPNSFYEILRICSDADYYAFADQDDYWLPDKLSRAIGKLEEEKDDNIPLMYCCSYDYYTDNGKFIRNFRLSKAFDIYKSLYYTAASGFVLVFNDSLRKKALRGTDGINKDDFGELHDRRFIRVAQFFGKLIFDEYAGARHIRHTEAVTGADSTNLHLLINWIKKEMFGNDMIKQKRGLTLFYDNYVSELDDCQKEVLELFCNEKKMFRKLFCMHRLRERLTGEVLIRLLFLVGKI